MRKVKKWFGGQRIRERRRRSYMYQGIGHPSHGTIRETKQSRINLIQCVNARVDLQAGEKNFVNKPLQTRRGTYGS